MRDKRERSGGKNLILHEIIGEGFKQQQVNALLLQKLYHPHLFRKRNHSHLLLNFYLANFLASNPVPVAHKIVTFGKRGH